MLRLTAALLAALAVMAMLAASGSAHPTNPLDRDHDQIENQDDNCPDDYNRDQVDTDFDGVRGGTSELNRGGDACDTDDDGDGVDDPVDNCPLEGNEDQRDTDSDGTGDLCDLDDDADGVPDRDDRCVKVPDPRQEDADDDFIGDACDPEPGRRTAAPPAPSPGPNQAQPSSTAGRDPDDRTPPELRLFVARRLTPAALRGGLPVELACSEACRVTASVAHGGRTLGRGEAAVSGPGVTFAFVDFSKRSLARMRRARRVVITLDATDPQGNRMRLKRGLRLR